MMRQAFMICTALALVPAGLPAQEAVGTTEWTAPLVTARETREATASRTVGQYEPLNRDELVETDGRGALDAVFGRGSRILIGPGCDLVLDESVYDPRLDDVVSFDVFSQTFCVVRGGAGAEAIVLETPIATVTISAAAATVSYASGGQQAAATDDGSPVPMAAHRAAAGPAAGQARLVAVFDAGLGAGNGFVEVVAGEARAVLRRPGYAVVVGEIAGLAGPAPADPGDVAAAIEQLETAVVDDSLAPPDLAANATDYAEVLRTVRQLSPGIAGRPFKCAAGGFCDAEVTLVPEPDCDSSSASSFFC